MKKGEEDEERKGVSPPYYKPKIGGDDERGEER